MKEEDFRRIIREELLRIFPHQEFLEMLNNEVVHSLTKEDSEIKRIVSKLNKEFNVSEFLSVYNDISNPLRFEKMFTPKNTKKFIDIFMDKNKGVLSYRIGTRKWIIL